MDPELASSRYLDALPETVVLIDHAAEVCEFLSLRGEIGIITNGIQSVQQERINNSKIAPFISFVCVSDECGYAKPDVRFFEYTAARAKKFTKESTLVVGDRFDADIVGAHNFGVHSCWFNPSKTSSEAEMKPRYEIRHLSELRKILG